VFGILIHITSKFLPVTCHEGIERELRYRYFFNLGARCGWVVNAAHWLLYLRELPGTHFIGGGWAPGLIWMDMKNITSTRI
jgi:hypothetical protein